MCYIGMLVQVCAVFLSSCMCYIGMLVQVCAVCVFLSCCMLVQVCAVCVSELLYVLCRYAGPSVCSMCF